MLGTKTRTIPIRKIDVLETSLGDRAGEPIWVFGFAPAPRQNYCAGPSQPAGRNPYVRSLLEIKPVVRSFRCPLAATCRRQQYSNSSRYPRTCSAPKSVRFQYIKSASWRPCLGDRVGQPIGAFGFAPAPSPKSMRWTTPASRQQYSDTSRIPGTCSAPKSVRFQYVKSMSWRPFGAIVWGNRFGHSGLHQHRA